MYLRGNSIVTDDRTRPDQTPFTLAARGLEEPCASFPDFCNNRQFPVIYCVRLCTLFRRISDSRFTWIHDFEE